MADATISLLSEAAFSFVGTVERLPAPTAEGVPADERTAVVRVDRVLQAPPAFSRLAGTSVTLQLLPDAEPSTVGSSFVFFANGLAFGAGIALTEVGRQPVEDVEPHLETMATPGASAAIDALQREVVGARLREHSATADAVVLARVVGLERASGAPVREHDPDWWRATLHVTHVERGDMEDDSDVKVLYANSLDVQWRDSPKPKASQSGLWLLHATEGESTDLAPFHISHPEDLQPVQNLELMRGS